MMKVTLTTALGEALAAKGVVGRTDVGAPMKYEQLLRRLIPEFYEPWMDADDKEVIAQEVMRQFGAEIDAAIDVGIANGHSEEQQEQICRAIWKSCKAPLTGE